MPHLDVIINTMHKLKLFLITLATFFMIQVVKQSNKKQMQLLKKKMKS